MQRTIHIKELPMFTYNLWMHPDTLIMSIIVSSYQHYDEQQFQILSCALYTIFFSNKVRFSHTSTVTRLHFCYEKNTRTPRVHLVFI